MFYILPSDSGSEEKVQITQDCPGDVKPGDEFTVSLTIHKGKIEGFARLQQYLPEGFIAREGESKGADFIFEENSVKFNWLKLPKESDFTISYKISTVSGLSGKKIINGVFVYVDADKTQRQQIAPKEIFMMETAVQSNAVPDVSRKLVTLDKSKGSYRVELTFHPNKMNESAQFTDEVPSGFTAEVIDAHEAAFRFENNTAVFSWKNFPVEKEFLVTYNVYSGKDDPAPQISGLLVFGDTSESKELPIAIETPASEDFKPEPTENKIAVNTSAPATITADNSSNNADPYIPVSEKGITYKVQISATVKSTTKDNSWFNEKYHINSPVELTLHEGWKKYLLGSFPGYSEASAFRKQTQSKVSDAFIVAYQNGVRIPVTEAIRNKSLNQ